MANVTCIDVSYCQTNVNYTKVKAAGITAVIIRAGYGRETSQKDNQFETHYKNAKAAGLKIGAYWYSYASSVADAKKEAAACLTCVKGKTFDLPIYFDMEDSSQTKYGKATLTSMAKAFCEAIKAGGYRAGVYANLNWFNNYLDYSALKSLYSIWLAQYNSTNSKTCDIWQNSSTGKINGISGNVDTDVIFNSSVISSSSSTSSSASSTSTTTGTSVKVVNKTSYLRSQAYVDDTYKTSKKLKTLKVGTSLTWMSDDGYGWSKCKASDGTTGWIQNSRINKSGLSKYPLATVTGNSVRVRKKPNGTILKLVNKGTTFTAYYQIPSGTNKNWTAIAVSGQDGDCFISSDYVKLTKRK